MKKILLVALTFHAIFFSAQKKDNCEDIINKWNTIGAFSQPSIESVKKCISKDERKIKIIGEGNGERKGDHKVWNNCGKLFKLFYRWLEHIYGGNVYIYGL